MAEFQNIVIIGAGHALANTLTPNLPGTHRILLIDANEFTYWPIAALRAAVQPGWEDKVTIPLSTAKVFPAGSVNQVIAPNKVVELKGNSVVLEKPFEGSTEVPFFKCILATGALQPAPMRPRLGASLSETHEMLRKIQAELGKAKKIVIIGGGPVGLEVAGEIRDRNPDSTITIVHNQSAVLNPSPNPNPDSSAEHYTAPSSYPKLSNVLESELKAMKIDVIHNDRVEIPTTQGLEGDWDGSFGLQAAVKTVKLKSGKSLEADYVFVGVGNQPGSGLVETADKGAIVDKMVAVDDFLRVRSTSPDSILTKNYYAIGDVSSTPGWKTSQTAMMDGQYAATNILADIKGTKAKKYSRSPLHFLMVPLGKSHGAGSMTMPYFGTFMAPKFMISSVKGKDLFIAQSFVGRFKGAEKVPLPSFK